MSAIPCTSVVSLLCVVTPFDTFVSAAVPAAAIASDLAVATVVAVARTEVSAIPCTSVVSTL